MRILLLLLPLALFPADGAAEPTVAWHAFTHSVTVSGESGVDAGFFWGHQSIIVRSGDHLYAGVMDSYGPESFDRRLRRCGSVCLRRGDSAL